MSFPEKKKARVDWNFEKRTIPYQGHYLSSVPFGTPNTKFHLEVGHSGYANKYHFRLYLDSNTGMKIPFDANFNYLFENEWKTVKLNGGMFTR